MTPEEFYGDAIELVTGSSAVLRWSRRFRLVTVNFTAPGLTLTLPDANVADMPFGRSILVVANVGANAFEAANGLYGTITVNPAEALFCAKVDDNGTPELLTTKYTVL